MEGKDGLPSQGHSPFSNGGVTHTAENMWSVCNRCASVNLTFSRKEIQEYITHVTVRCRDRPSLPFRCLDPQYRRELVRVYLTNVEGICRRFVDEKRESLLRIKETAASFKAYWASQTPNDKKALVQHKGSDMLKVGFALTLHWLSACLHAQVLSQQN